MYVTLMLGSLMILNYPMEGSLIIKNIKSKTVTIFGFNIVWANEFNTYTFPRWKMSVLPFVFLASLECAACLNMFTDMVSDSIPGKDRTQDLIKAFPQDAEDNGIVSQ